MASIVYLHGFLSGPGTTKAQLLREYLHAQNLPIELWVPALPEEPARALAAAQAAVQEAMARTAGPVGVVGSSMGGFYATILAERFALSAVLVNPAVYPQDLIQDYLGEIVNPYSGRRFVLDQSDVASIVAMTPVSTDRARLWLLVQTGDEVLDYRRAVDFYAGHRQTVVEGGDHRFAGFDQYLPEIINFLQCAPELH